MFCIGAEHTFHKPNYKKVDCGDSENSSSKQAGIVHIAKVLAHQGDITAWPISPNSLTK